MNPGRFTIFTGALAILVMLSGCYPSSRIEGGLKTIQFSGYEWIVKSSTERVGPGPNLFSEENVWVDEQGYLHLKVSYQNERWSCAEVISRRRFGYGTYVFKLVSRVDHLDPNIVAGFFTWHPGRTLHNREVDIEFSRWGKSDGPNGVYVVQPADHPGHKHPFYFSQPDVNTTHVIRWSRREISFSTHEGYSTGITSSPALHAWTYRGAFKPRARNVQARINLWLFGGRKPVFPHETELVIREFSYIPL